MADLERVTADGREVSPDGGVTWLLVEPSPAWLDRQIADNATPEPDIDPEHASDDPLAAEVAGLRAVVEALLADPEIAKVADIEAIRTAAEGSKGDDALVLAVAKALGADPAEVRKKRDADPQWFADIVTKYGLDQGKEG